MPAKGERTVAQTNGKQRMREEEVWERLNGLLHAPSHQQEKVVDVWEDEEEEDGAEEHGHPGAMILAEHFQAQVST